MRGAAIAATLLALLTGCGGEVVHPRGAAPIFPSDMAGPDQCLTEIDVFDTGQLLRPAQIMAGPADRGAGQQSWMYVISPDNCGSSGYTQPQCDSDFPWTGTGTDDIGAVLGPIGVTSLVTSITRFDVPAASVTETILTLSGAAGSILDTFANDCAYVQIQSDIYTAEHGTDAYEMLQIRGNVAIGMEFDDTGLDDAQRRDILDAAVAQVPPA